MLDKLTYAGDEETHTPLRDNPHLRFLGGDICDRPIVYQAVQGCDWVTNSAAETHVDRSIEDPGTFVAQR